MSSLSDKLKSLGVQVGTEQIKAPKKNRQSDLLIDIFDGGWEKTNSGDCFVVNKKIPIESQHGQIALNQMQKSPLLERLPGLAGISKVPLSSYLFIDTETSSLSGGTGSYVFLIGAAKYFRSQIQFKQFFLEDPANEPAQLAALENFASSAKVIISYNGKSFDLPRIKTRYKLHGWPVPFDDIWHIDLLHIARRLWKNHLPSCNLGEIEYQLLGVRRSDLDIPGWEIASHFFEYLQSGDPSSLKSVFYHNEIDVISLISLLIYILDRLSNPLSYPSEDLLSIALYLSYLDYRQEAITVLSEALESGYLSEHQETLGLNSLAQLHKQNKDFQKSIPLWKETASRGEILSPFVELAMYYEHKEKDLQEAIHWTLSAIDMISKQSSPSLSDDSLHLNHRLTRLKRKLSNSQEAI
jgi:hypothetical protein